MRSRAASAVRASATPWPSMVASISMLARLRIGPRATGSATPAAADHLDQVFQSSRRSSGNFSRAELGLLIHPVVMRGLDPRIHLLRKMSCEGDDPRVEPAGDGGGCCSIT